METRERKELQAILTNEGGNLYDFVCNNAYLLEKEDLKDLCKEAIYLLYEAYQIMAVKKGDPIEQGDHNLHEAMLDTLKENTAIFED